MITLWIVVSFIVGSEFGKYCTNRRLLRKLHRLNHDTTHLDSDKTKQNTIIHFLKLAEEMKIISN